MHQPIPFGERLMGFIVVTAWVITAPIWIPYLWFDEWRITRRIPK